MGKLYLPNYRPPQPIRGEEERVRQELQKIDRLLDIMWFDGIYYNEGQGCWEGRYGLVVHWPPTDGRWKDVREQGYTEAYDLLGWFAEDIHDAGSIPQSPYMMMRKVYDLLANADNESAPWYSRMKQVFAKNLEHQESLMSEIEAEVEEEAERTYVEDFKYKAPRVGYGD